MRSSSSAYIPRLDHVRAVAMVLVLCWHSCHVNGVIPVDATLPRFFALSIFDEGHTGVSLFLTLSGFIFASLSHGRGIQYWPFIRNRLLRLLPLLFTWTLINFTLSTVTSERLLANLLTGMGRSDFPGVGWTVLIEFQLYLVFPFFVRFTRHYGVRYLVGVVAVALLLRSLVWITTRNVQFFSYWTVVGRVDEFVLGMLGAEASRRYGKQLGKVWVLVAVSMTWLLIMHWFNQLGGYYRSAMTPIGNPLWIYLPTLEGLFYAIIIASYLNVEVRGSRTLGRWFAFVGTLTYSFYLNHEMVARACYTLLASAGIGVTTPYRVVAVTAFVVFPVLLACSALTYYVIELPFLSLRSPYATDLPSDAAVLESTPRAAK
jgi:peptidoglycan/LPS O-acetylase OafA/YrhL